MTLRLFLIGLVAGMGLGLPAKPTIEGWAGGVQTWVNHQTAALHSRAGSEPKYLAIRDMLAEEMQRAQAAHPARLSPPAAPNAEPRIRLASLPLTISSDEIAIAALARVGTTIITPQDLIIAPDVAPTVAVPCRRPAFAVPVGTAARPDELALLAWNGLRPIGARLATGLADGLRSAADRDRDARAFTAMGTATDLYFDGAFALEARVEPVPPPAAVLAAAETLPEPAAPSDSREFAPLPGFEGLDPIVAVEDAVPDADDGPPAPEAFAESTMSYAEAVAAMDDLPDNVFAPIDDAPSEPVAVQEPPTSPVAAHDVNRAVRLTREAFSAWVGVLTGPAVVTVSGPTPAVR